MIILRVAYTKLVIFVKPLMAIIIMMTMMIRMMIIVIVLHLLTFMVEQTRV